MVSLLSHYVYKVMEILENLLMISYLVLLQSISPWSEELSDNTTTLGSLENKSSALDLGSSMIIGFSILGFNMALGLFSKEWFHVP